jgi:hypothetical protein
MEKLKDKKFAFRVSERDLNQIRIKAKRARMTVTDYLVASALNKDIVVIDGVEGLITQMKAVGKNLNQLTTLAQIGRGHGKLRRYRRRNS